MPSLRAALLPLLPLLLACNDGGGGGTSRGSAASGSTGGGASPAPAPTAPAAADTVILVAPGVEAELAPLVGSHRARGRAVAVVPLDAVRAPGRDRAEEIRAWLADRLDDGRRRDLLLVGSPAAIPIRRCAVGSGPPVASDLYYGDLTGDWDRDGDRRWGELDEDAVDVTAELRVGRIPYDTPAHVAAAVAAIERARARGDAWQARALLVAGTILTPGDAPLGAEQLRAGLFAAEGWAADAAYAPSSPLQGNLPLGRGSVARDLQLAPRALVAFFSHGSPWELASAEPSGSLTIYEPADLQALPSDRPPVLVAAACSAGDPGAGVRLGQDALRHGAAGFLGATVVVDPRSGGGAGFDAVLEVSRRLARGEPLGEVLTGTTERYYAAGMAAATTTAERAEVQREALGGVLYGDPTLSLGPNAM